MLKKLLLFSVASIFVGCSPAQVDTCLLSSEEAEELALQMTLQEELEWGSVESVEYDEVRQIYRIYFPTEEVQIELLGRRGIDVNCITGETTIQPRE